MYLLPCLLGQMDVEAQVGLLLKESLSRCNCPAEPAPAGGGYGAYIVPSPLQSTMSSHFADPQKNHIFGTPKGSESVEACAMKLQCIAASELGHTSCLTCMRLIHQPYFPWIAKVLHASGMDVARIRKGSKASNSRFSILRLLRSNLLDKFPYRLDLQ